MTDPIRILLVDDQPLVRSGFAMLVGSQEDLVVVGQAGDGLEAVAAVERLAGTPEQPDVVLMDIRMPRMDGLEAARRVLAEHPQVTVVLLTTFDLDEYALEGIRAGASGFLLKDAQPEELLGALRTCFRGDAVIAPSTTQRLLRRFIDPPQRTVSDDPPSAGPDAARAGGLRAGGPGAVQPGDHGRAGALRAHRQDACVPGARQARRPGPGASGGVGPRARPGGLSRG